MPDDGDFGKYKLLVAPLQYLMNSELEERYFRYVKNGGHLVLTMRTGVKDETNICMTDRELPGRLSELTGSDIITVKEGAEVLAVYASEFYAGEPCVTKNEYGQGCCYYIGTEPDEAFMAALVRYMTDAAGIAALGNADEGVELAAREKADRRWIFALNHTDRERTYSVDSSYRLVYGEEAGKLNGYEVQILERKI